MAIYEQTVRRKMLLERDKRIAVLEDLLRRIDAVTIWEHHPERWRLGSEFQEEIEAALGIGEKKP